MLKLLLGNLVLKLTTDRLDRLNPKELKRIHRDITTNVKLPKGTKIDLVEGVGVKLTTGSKDEVHLILESFIMSSDLSTVDVDYDTNSLIATHRQLKGKRLVVDGDTLFYLILSNMI